MNRPVYGAPVRTPYLSLILPAYNEVHTIAYTLDTVSKYLAAQSYAYEILVGVDGADGTRDVVEQLCAADPHLHVFGHTARCGKGRAVREGVEQARGVVIGFADADAKVPIGEIGQVLPWLANGYDVVIGSRRLAQSQIGRRAPLHRRLGSWMFARLVPWVAGVRGLADTQCGFKFFRRPVAQDLFARLGVDGYMFDVEILGLAQILEYRIKEIGVEWRDDGDTRFDPIRGTWTNFGELLGIRESLRRVRSARSAEQAS